MDQRSAWSSHHWQTWSSHHWQTRTIENGVYNGVVHHHCARCLRDFVDDPSTGERYAVYVAVFSFERLPELTTAKWLRDLCPGMPVVQDGAIRKRATSR
jgi:hypothetical protein